MARARSTQVVEEETVAEGEKSGKPPILDTIEASYGSDWALARPAGYVRVKQFHEELEVVGEDGKKSAVSPGQYVVAHEEGYEVLSEEDYNKKYESLKSRPKGS